MATQAQYQAAEAAINSIVQAEIKKEVPAMFQNQIPRDLVAQFVQQAAKAAVDAAEKTT